MQQQRFADGHSPLWTTATGARTPPSRHPVPGARGRSTGQHRGRLVEHSRDEHGQQHGHRPGHQLRLQTGDQSRCRRVTARPCRATPPLPGDGHLLRQARAPPRRSSCSEGQDNRYPSIGRSPSTVRYAVHMAMTASAPASPASGLASGRGNFVRPGHRRRLQLPFCVPAGDPLLVWDRCSPVRPACNAKTGVSKAHRYDPDVNPTYHNFAMHYGFGVLPARPYKPRDKAVVESAVQVAQRWIVAALRHRKFFSLEEPTRRSANCSTGSITGPSVSAMAAARVCSNRSTNLL